MSAIEIVTPDNHSFFQDKPYITKSNKFIAVKPSGIEEMLKDHGFNIVHLKTGRARKEDTAAFQTTIARYRSQDAFEVQGLSLDIIFKVPHLYGAITGVLGLFRGVCSNQLNVGTHF